MPKINLKESFDFLVAEESSKRNSNNESGILSIVNTKKHGKRVMFSKQLEEDLQLQGKIQIAIAKDGSSIVLGVMLDKSQKSYVLSRLKKGNESSRYVLYNTAVVEEITEKLKLDFSVRTTITFHEIEYMEYDGTTIAKVWLKGEC